MDTSSSSTFLSKFSDWLKLLGLTGVLGYVLGYAPTHVYMKMLGAPITSELKLDLNPQTFTLLPTIFLGALGSFIIVALLGGFFAFIIWLICKWWICKVRYTWRPQTSLHPVVICLIAGLCVLVLVPSGQLAQFRDLLISRELSDNAFGPLLIFPDKYKFERGILWGNHVIVSGLLLKAIHRYWNVSSEKWRFSLAAVLIFALIVAATLIPISIAALHLSNIPSPKITIEIGSNASKEAYHLEGYMIMKTSEEIALYSTAPIAESGKIHLLTRATANRMMASGTPERVLRVHYCHQPQSIRKPLPCCAPSLKDCRLPRVWKWMGASTLGLAVLTLLVFADSGQRASTASPASNLSIWILLTWLVLAVPIPATFAAPLRVKPATAETLTPTQPKLPPKPDRKSIPTPETFVALLNTFYPFIKSSGDTLFTLLESITSFHLGEETSDVATPALTNLNVWRYDLTTQLLHRLTQGGGYASPMPSPDGKRLAFLKAGSLCLLEDGLERVLHESTTYRQILAWNTQHGALLVATADGRLFQIKEADGTAAEVVLDRRETPFATLETLQTLARTTPDLVRLKAETFGNSWAVMAEHERYEEPRLLFELPNRITDPVMTADQTSVFFVSDRQ